MSKIAIDQQPKFLDAIIPGRYHYRLGLHDAESPKEIGSGHPVKNLVTTVWLAWFPFWLFLTMICGSVEDFDTLTAGLFSPFGGMVMFATPCLFVFYPGCYYLFFRQGQSLRHVSHHIFSNSSSRHDLLESERWLSWWRAALLPGIDVGNLRSKRLGVVTGAMQIATFLAPFWAYSGPVLVRLLSGGRADSFWLFDLLASMLVWNESPAIILVSWGVSLMFFLVNQSYGRRWVQHVVDMSQEERAALPL